VDRIAPSPLEVIVAAVWCGRRLVARIDRDLEVHGLTWGQFHALVVFERQNGWMHAGALGRRLGVSRQAAHALVHRLVDRGFLRWDERAGWVRSARLTPTGHEALADAYEALTDVFAAIERLTIDERQQVVSAENSIHRELQRRQGWEPW
jgi:DNA-binding MarR family transcriptional regulator